jgi:hypothetical protein
MLQALLDELDMERVRVRALHARLWAERSSSRCGRGGLSRRSCGRARCGGWRDRQIRSSRAGRCLGRRRLGVQLSRWELG